MSKVGNSALYCRSNAIEGTYRKLSTDLLLTFLRFSVPPSLVLSFATKTMTEKAPSTWQADLVPLSGTGRLYKQPE